MQLLRLRFQNLVDDLSLGASGEWGVPRQHEIEHASQAEQIRTGVDLFAPQGFRGHIRWRSDTLIVRGQFDVVKGNASQPEVRQLGTGRSFVQHDVSRLHVAMHDSLSMGRRESLGNLSTKPDHLQGIEGSLVGDMLSEGVSTDVLHHQKRDSVLFLNRVNRQDMRMTDGCGRPCLAEESSSGRGAVQQLISQDLDGHGAVQVRIECLPDHAHSAASQRLLNLVLSQLPLGSDSGPRPPQESRRRVVEQGRFLGRPAGVARLGLAREGASHAGTVIPRPVIPGPGDPQALPCVWFPSCVCSRLYHEPPRRCISIEPATVPTCHVVNSGLASHGCCRWLAVSGFE